jgi:hypothetical protein
MIKIVESILVSVECSQHLSGQFLLLQRDRFNFSFQFEMKSVIFRRYLLLSWLDRNADEIQPQKRMANSVFLPVANSFSCGSIQIFPYILTFFYRWTVWCFDWSKCTGSVLARGILDDTFSDWVHTGNMTISIYKYIMSWCLCSPFRDGEVHLKFCNEVRLTDM